MRVRVSFNLTNSDIIESLMLMIVEGKKNLTFKAGVKRAKEEVLDLGLGRVSCLGIWQTRVEKYDFLVENPTTVPISEIRQTAVSIFELWKGA